MGLKDDLENEVATIFRDQWSSREGRKVPEVADVQLGNDAVEIEGVVLYADLSDSTKLVDGFKWTFAAEVYKTFLLCASRLIKANGGVITAFDGDRVMAIFIGDAKNSDAVRCALQINWAAKNVVNPALVSQYPKTQYRVQHVVGIDRSVLRAARTGVWGSNDLVWVGRAANYAAKLTTVNDPGYPTFITKAVYDKLNDASKYGEGKDMWEERVWTAMNGIPIYRSGWWWAVS